MKIMIAVSVLNGVQGGSRTHKTLILSQVPMPIRLLGQVVLLSGVEPARPVYKTGAKIPFRV